MGRSKPKDPTYPGMPPIARLHRPWVLTEKIDGTNGLIAVKDVTYISRDPEDPSTHWPPPLATYGVLDETSREGWKVHGIWAGSKNQWLGPDGDNFGFGAWVRENHAALILTLGEGLHRGEWWGSGIQTGYGLPKGERRFSLFNTSRFDPAVVSEGVPGLGVVPLLTDECPGHRVNEVVAAWLAELEMDGSRAAPGFMNPEGVVAFQPSSQVTFKATIVGDETPKSLVRRG